DEMADKSGAFEVPMDDGHWIKTVVVKHPRYAPFKTDGLFLNETHDQEITITLNDIEEWFYGRVLTDQDAPVHGASVEIEYRSVEGKENGLNHRFNYRATSDSTGFFAQPYFTGMKFTLKARKEREQSKLLTGFSEKELVPGTSCAELVFSTKDNLYINFSCTRSSGKPLVDFHITSGGVKPSGVTDSRGKVSWEHLENRTYYANIFGPHKVIGVFGVGINPGSQQDRYCCFEMIPGRFVEVRAALSLAGKASEEQAGSMQLQFEEQRGDQWESPATLIPSIRNKRIEWERRIYQEKVYIDVETGCPVVTFTTYLYEGIFRLKLSAPGFQEKLSEPFAISEHPDTLRMSFTLSSL
ncbi:MAG: hypothetical protein ABIK28_12665, partial [Planctomycetota bacterium]